MPLTFENETLHFETTSLVGKEMWYEHFDVGRMTFANGKPGLSFSNHRKSREGLESLGMQAVGLLHGVGIL
ncbi:MAG: hypothetical protein KJ718_05030 [Nanoarchaeota archaeon]|nr:hypothetical protein [Nanoarchaeota archaeon]